MNTNEILIKAAERLRTRGWFGGNTRERIGAECAMIAISEVSQEGVSYGDKEWVDRRTEARDKLLEFVGVEPNDNDSALWNWNDAQPNGETVINAMLGAAGVAKHPTPTRPGFYWAKLIHPTRMPDGEDWASVDWEPVEVFDNNGEDDERLGVSVPGIGPMQWVLDFVWGPEIPAYRG